MDDSTTKDARTWAMLCHLTSFSGYFIPFGNFLGPFVCWLLRKNEFPFVDFHGREALNFQMSIFLYLVISILLCFVLVGFLLLPAILILDIVCTIIAAMRANDGQYYRYPLTIRFLGTPSPTPGS